MSARPGRLATMIDVNLPYPRNRVNNQFNAYVDKAAKSLEHSMGRKEA